MRDTAKQAFNYDESEVKSDKDSSVPEIDNDDDEEDESYGDDFDDEKDLGIQVLDDEESDSGFDFQFNKVADLR